MLAKVYSAAIVGLDAQPIEVELDLSAGLHCFQIVGLPDAAVKEAKERVSSAIKNTGISPPQHSRKRVIVNLAPADLKKQGPAYDLPIAVAFLIASKELKLNSQDIKDKLFVGELSLEGKVRPVNGVLSIGLLARQMGLKTLFIPKENAREAGLIKGIDIVPIESLEQLINYLTQRRKISFVRSAKIERLVDRHYDFDMAYVRGQAQIKRALEIAAAGGHNVLMYGPPGAGKTLLARSFASILPSLSREEIFEITRIFSVAGELSPGAPFVFERPFRSPHHTASVVSLIGGGSYPRPGEITLAHRGVLFLDELPEFTRHFLESLRQPLEDGVITVSRASKSLTFPARFIFIGAMNPCPCGKLGGLKESCVCSSAQVSNYQRKLSAPLLDRIDIYIEVPRLRTAQFSKKDKAESSAKIRERVEKARKIQAKRFFNEKKIITNNEMGLRQIRNYCPIDSAGLGLLKSALDRLNLSARGYYRILKLARTISDLAGEKSIQPVHIAEAIQYRKREPQ